MVLIVYRITISHKLMQSVWYQVNSLTDNKGGMTLRRLFVWIQEPLERMKLMAVVVDTCKGDGKGFGSFAGDFIDELINAPFEPGFANVGHKIVFLQS